MIALVCLFLGLGDPELAFAGPARSSSASDGLRRYEAAETHMGSEFKIVLYCSDESTARRGFRAAFDRIAYLDSVFSDYQPDSELMRLCDKAGGPPVPVSEDLFAILQRARAMYERSDGAFDVTVGPIVRLWRRARRDRHMPAPEALVRARALVSTAFLELDEKARTVRLTRPGMKLDLGGIAKGYASDAAIQTLRKQGIDRALVAGAGDIVVSGPPPGRTGWTIGIAPLDNPQARPSIILSLHDAAASTSGDAERFVVIDGKRYAHIVDPKTGLGVISRTSVTIIERDGATADALATAVFCAGPEKGLRVVESSPTAAAYIITASETAPKTLESTQFRSLPRASPTDSHAPAANLKPD